MVDVLNSFRTPFIGHSLIWTVSDMKACILLLVRSQLALFPAHATFFTVHLIFSRVQKSVFVILLITRCICIADYNFGQVVARRSTLCQRRFALSDHMQMVNSLSWLRIGAAVDSWLSAHLQYLRRFCCLRNSMLVFFPLVYIDTPPLCT